MGHISPEYFEKINHNSTLEFLKPSNFGWIKHENGYLKRIKDTEIIASNLSWGHSQVGTRGSINSLQLFSLLQKFIFDDPTLELVPPEMLAIIESTGGKSLVVYERDKGFNARVEHLANGELAVVDMEGCLAITVGLGSIDKTLRSHFTGVHPNRRGQHIGWNLKVLQGYEAAKTGHEDMTWTFDPMLGNNANVNIASLGGVVQDFIIDKYGENTSGLYHTNYSDRFQLEWHFSTKEVQERLSQFKNETLKKTRTEDVIDVPEVNLDNLERILINLPPKIKYEIPGNTQDLPSEVMNEYRAKLRMTIGQLLNCVSVDTHTIHTLKPHRLNETVTYGPYMITDFVSGFENDGRNNKKRKNYYILTLK